MNILKIPKQIILLFLISLLPIVIGSLLYFTHQHIHFKTLNHGVLLNPIINVNNFPMGKIYSGKWRIIYNQFEKANLLQQIPKALGKDGNRVKVINTKDFVGLPKIIAANRIYLIDPLGNLFMYYPPHVNPMDILKDLKRVLGVSQIG